MMEGVVGIDPDRAGPETIGDVDGRVQVRGMYGCGQTVSRAVAHSDRVGFRLELGDGTDGSEDLFAHDLHVFSDIAEDGRLDEVPSVAVSGPAHFDLGSFFFAFFNVAEVQVHGPLLACV